MKPMFSHPSDETLTELALTETLARDLDSVEQHVAECARCRDTMRGVRAMRETLADTDAPIASEVLLSKILARRAEGGRVELPAVDSTRLIGQVARRAGMRSRYLVFSGIAAALIAWIVWPEKAVPPTPPVTATLPTPPASDEAPSILSPWPNVAYAAVPPKDTQPLYQPLQVLYNAYTKGGTRTYVRSSASSYHDFMPIGSMSVEFTDMDWKGQHVWRIVTSNPFENGRMAYADTTWVRYEDLSLLYRRFHRFVLTQTMRVVNDTILETEYEIKHAVKAARKLPSNVSRNVSSMRMDPRRPLISDLSTFMLLLRHQTLSATWRGSIALASYRGQSGLSGRPAAVNVSVQGDSVVSTLWGHVPAWRVVVHTTPVPERWYVSKEGREVLLVTGPNGMEWPRSRLDLIGRFVK